MPTLVDPPRPVIKCVPSQHRQQFGFATMSGGEIVAPVTDPDVAIDLVRVTSQWRMKKPPSRPVLGMTASHSGCNGGDWRGVSLAWGHGPKGTGILPSSHIDNPHQANTPGRPHKVARLLDRTEKRSTSASP
jgi:hypothetical protein